MLEFSRLLPVRFLLHKVTGLPVVTNKYFMESRVQAASTPRFSYLFPLLLASGRGPCPSGLLTNLLVVSLSSFFLGVLGGGRAALCALAYSFIHSFVHSFIHLS